MSTKTQFSRPRRPRRPRKKRSRWQIYGSAASQLWKDVGKLKSMINVETKFNDQNFGQTLQSGAAVTLLNGLTEGDTAITREGMSIKAKYLTVKFHASANAAAVVNNSRVMIVLDRQPNGATPTITQILTADYPDAPRYLGNSYRFKILKDMRFSQVYGAANGAITRSINIPLKFHTRYYPAANAGTVADIATNALYLFVTSDQPTNGAVAVFYTRFRWIDN